MPGLSIPQGFIITLLGLGLLWGRMPPMPGRILALKLSKEKSHSLLMGGAQILRRLETWSLPRLQRLVEGSLLGFSMAGINKLIILLCAILLMAPFPIPFSNVLPAYGILLLSLGTLRRDGLFVLFGHTMLLLTVAYVGGVFTLGTVLLQKLM